MSSLSPRVLLFDSGVGGLSIAQAIWRRIPAMRLTYLADNAFFPYGDQAESRVIDRCVNLIQQATEDFPVDMVVVACNTASTVVLPSLRAALGLPVVGVVPAIKPAAAITRNRRIGLLATPATVDRPYIDRLVSEHAADCRIVRVGSSELVRMAEASLDDGRVSAEALRPIVEPFVLGEVDTVVLGCTHFPLVRSSLQKALPWMLNWVDSGEAIARRVEYLAAELETAPPEAEGTAHELLFTGHEPAGLDAWIARVAAHRCHVTAGFPGSQVTARRALIRSGGSA